MGAILKKARKCRRRTSCCGWDYAVNELLPGGSLFSAIEAEFQELRDKIEENSIAVGEHLKKQGERIEALEKRVLRNLQKECELLYSLESRIKTLEESEKQNEYLQKGLIDLQSFKEWLQTLEIKKPVPTVKENIPTDKDGNPEGGLKSNDLIRSILQEDYGLFACADGNKIWAVWKKGGYAWVDKSLVIFVYRPKSPEPKDC